jgi:hypothetical protein
MKLIVVTPATLILRPLALGALPPRGSAFQKYRRTDCLHRLVDEGNSQQPYMVKPFYDPLPASPTYV